MNQSVIQRVDFDKLEAMQGSSGKGPRPRLPDKDGSFSSQMVRWFTIPLSVILCILMSMVTISSSNNYNFTITCTLVAVIVTGTIFTMALVLNPLLRVIYLGRWMNVQTVTRLNGIQNTLGALALTSLAALGAVSGLSFLWTVLAIVAVLLVITAVGSWMMVRRPEASSSWASVMHGAIRWLVAMVVSALVLWGLAPRAPLWAVAALPVLAAAGYALCWVLTTRALTRAELMTIFAALVVTSGISTFGLTEQLVPLITTPYNPEWNTPQSRWSQELHPNLRKELFITDGPAITEYREGLKYTLDKQPLIAPPDKDGFDSWVAWTEYYWKVATNLPWNLWVSPLAYWLIFVFGCYALFYSLSYTVLDFWATREKLIFPLAQLRETLLPDPESTHWLPAITRSPGFWAALAVAGGVFSYNACVRFGWLGDMGLVPQGMNLYTFASTVKDTFLQGIAGGANGMRFALMFTAIGIAFLLPLEISFSIWFYYLVTRVMFLALAGAGYGQTMMDFPSDWLYVQNQVTAQGMGALLVFSAFMLYRALKDTGSQSFSRSRPVKARLLSGLPVIGLVASITVVTMWIWWMWQWNISYLIWAFVFVLFLTLLTLGLMRITAEGGIYWFQAHSSFFHLWKMLALGKFLPGTIIGPLLPVYSVLFLDIKTFMAPNILDSAKMHKDVGGSRTIYHLNMVISIVVAVLTSVSFAIIMAYVRGAQRMHSWFYSNGPKSTMSTAQQAASSVPEFNTSMACWALGGGLWVALSVFLRRTIFWFPHPVGYVMLINPMIHTLWFSFFIGWICKKLVVKYGGKNTFDKTRDIFIGLIMGEIIAIFGWAIFTMITGKTTVGMTLNNTF